MYVYIPRVQHYLIVSIAPLLLSALPPFHGRVSDNDPLKLTEAGGGGQLNFVTPGQKLYSGTNRLQITLR